MRQAHHDACPSLRQARVGGGGRQAHKHDHELVTGSPNAAMPTGGLEGDTWASTRVPTQLPSVSSFRYPQGFKSEVGKEEVDSPLQFPSPRFFRYLQGFKGEVGFFSTVPFISCLRASRRKGVLSQFPSSGTSVLQRGGKESLIVFSLRRLHSFKDGGRGSYCGSLLHQPKRPPKVF